MARYAIVFDRDARTDLKNIENYIANERTAEFAKEFVQRIILYCESFATIPHRGTKLDTIRPGLRTITWRRTITIAFRVSDTTKQVVILAALYRGRDVLSVLQRRNA